MTNRESLRILVETLPDSKLDEACQALQNLQDLRKRLKDLSLEGVRISAEPIHFDEFEPIKVELQPGERTVSEQLIHDRR